MTSLKSSIGALAETFASSVLAAIRSASLEEILAGGDSAPAKRGPGRPPKSATAAAPSAFAKRGPGRPPKSVGSTAPKPPAKRGPGRPAKSAAPAAPAATAPRKGKGGRLARRSPEELEKVIALVVAALKGSKGGLRSEQLQTALKLDKKEITGPLNQALAGKKITKKGQKRSTTYFAT
jgi:hypothetical protein